MTGRSRSFVLRASIGAATLSLAVGAFCAPSEAKLFDGQKQASFGAAFGETKANFLHALAEKLLGAQSDRFSTPQADPNVNPFVAGTTWNNSAAWGLGHTPVGTDELLFDHSILATVANTTLDASFAAQTLAFDTGADVFAINANASGTTGRTLTLGGGTNALGGTDLLATSGTTTGTITFGGTSGVGILTLALGTDGAFNIANANENVIFGANSIISGVGRSLTKTGAGTLQLGGANTYTGATNINAGKLQLNASNSLQNSVVNLNVNGGLTFASGLTTASLSGLGGTGSLALTNLGSSAIALTLGSNNGSASYGGSLSGAGSLTKTGSGTQTLTGANSYTGQTIINGGALAYSGSGSYTGIIATTPLLLQNGGTLNINTSGTLTFTTSNVSYSEIGYASAGAVNQTSGTLSLQTNTGVDYLELGPGSTSAYGSYVLSGGTLTVGTGVTAGLRVAGADASVAAGYGVFTQTGGILNVRRFFVISGGGLNAFSTGVSTFTGGAAGLGTGGYVAIIGNRPNNIGTMNVGTETGGSASVIAYAGIQVGGATATNATLNLNSGVLNLGGTILLAGGTGTLNLNGATLRGATNLTLVDNSLSSINVFNGGITVDTQSFTDTISGGLAKPSGNGVYVSGGTLSLGAGTGGAGYIGAPIVTVSGGGGTGATAIANVSNGTVTGVTLTSPGQNYVVGQTLTFSFASGGAVTPATTFTYTLTAADMAANSTGGLTKTGSGQLILTANNSYTGGTVISNGSLKLANPSGVALSGSSTITVRNNGTLLMGANNQINLATTPPISLGTTGGAGTAARFDGGGFSQGTAGSPLTPNSGTIGLGALTLASNSVIDLTATSVLHFSNSSAQTWAGNLSIWNWSGTALSGGGTEQVLFGGDLTGLSATQLTQVSFYSDAGTSLLSNYASILADGEIIPGVVPVPEPATYMAAGLLLSLLLYREQGRFFARFRRPGASEVAKSRWHAHARA